MHACMHAHRYTYICMHMWHARAHTHIFTQIHLDSQSLPEIHLDSQSLPVPIYSSPGYTASLTHTPGWEEALPMKSCLPHLRDSLDVTWIDGWDSSAQKLPHVFIMAMSVGRPFWLV